MKCSVRCPSGYLHPILGTAAVASIWYTQSTNLPVISIPQTAEGNVVFVCFLQMLSLWFDSQFTMWLKKKKAAAFNWIHMESLWSGCFSAALVYTGSHSVCKCTGFLFWAARCTFVCSWLPGNLPPLHQSADSALRFSIARSTLVLLPIGLVCNAAHSQGLLTHLQICTAE